jgi:hypothetical protein
VDSTSPNDGEEVSSYSAVCLETSKVAAAELWGCSSAATSRDFRAGLREHPASP